MIGHFDDVLAANDLQHMKERDAWRDGILLGRGLAFIPDPI